MHIPQKKHKKNELFYEDVLVLVTALWSETALSYLKTQMPAFHSLCPHGCTFNPFLYLPSEIIRGVIKSSLNTVLGNLLQVSLLSKGWTRWPQVFCDPIQTIVEFSLYSLLCMDEGAGSSSEGSQSAQSNCTLHLCPHFQRCHRCKSQQTLLQVEPQGSPTPFSVQSQKERDKTRGTFLMIFLKSSETIKCYTLLNRVKGRSAIFISLCALGQQCWAWSCRSCSNLQAEVTPWQLSVHHGWAERRCCQVLRRHAANANICSQAAHSHQNCETSPPPHTHTSWQNQLLIWGSHEVTDCLSQLSPPPTENFALSCPSRRAAQWGSLHGLGSGQGWGSDLQQHPINPNPASHRGSLLGKERTGCGDPAPVPMPPCFTASTETNPDEELKKRWLPPFCF